MAIELQTSWPFLALVMSIAIGAPLLLRPYTATGRRESLVSRLSHWRFCMDFALPLYALHQYEEYGYDVFGRHYHFHQVACEQLGFPMLVDCPIKAWHLAFVNAVLVNLAATRGQGGRPAAVGPGANFYGLALVNGLLHTLVAVVHGLRGEEAYNPGLITGMAGLFPFGVSALRSLHREDLLSTAGVVRAVVLGIVTNILLIGSMPLRANGYIGDVGYVILGSINVLGLLSISEPR